MTKNRRRSKAASSHDASTPESTALKDSVGSVSQGDMSPVSLCQAVLRKQLTEGMSTYRNSEKGTYLGEGLHQEERLYKRILIEQAAIRFVEKNSNIRRE
uniref:Uncharacterized protein n=1 Tax=Magallana gigas TaxID=29159 RepID=K1R9M1_MAGGI